MVFFCFCFHFMYGCYCVCTHLPPQHFMLQFLLLYQLVVFSMCFTSSWQRWIHFPRFCLFGVIASASTQADYICSTPSSHMANPECLGSTTVYTVCLKKNILQLPSHSLSPYFFNLPPLFILVTQTHAHTHFIFSLNWISFFSAFQWKHCFCDLVQNGKKISKNLVVYRNISRSDMTLL